MSDNIIRTGLNLMNTAFNGLGGTVVSGEAVKGGYFVTPSVEITYKGEEGKIPDYACVLGTLCYCTGDKKFYQYLSVSREVDGTTTTTNEWVNIELNDVVTRLEAEIVAREKAIADEIKARGDEDTKLSTLITNEATERGEQDALLSQAISDERAAREAADTNLLTKINDETVRVNEELATIGEMLNKETTKLDILIGNDGDKSVRTIANEELASQLLSDSAEASFKTLQDLARWLEDHPEDVAAINTLIQQLQNDLAKEITRAQNIEQTLNTKINTEVSLREAQTNGLNFSLKEEIGRATQEEASINTKINAEIDRATAAENEISSLLSNKGEELSNLINEEKERAQSAECVLKDKIDNEVSLREAQINGLNFSLKEEVNRAKSAEETLQKNINAEAGLRGDLEAQMNRRFEDDEKLLEEKSRTLDGKIDEEIKRAKEEEGKLQSSLSAVEGSINKEIERASNKEDELEQKIEEITLTEKTVLLEEDLYTYVPIGNAQKASNEEIGSGEAISVTNRGKIGSAGDSLKDVFSKIFGEEVDTEPASIIDGRDISFNYFPSAALGKTTDEVGTAINTTSIDLTITAKGSCTSTYGYYISLDEEGKPKDFVYNKSGVTLNYVVATQTIGEGESKIEYKLKLVLPEDYNTKKISTNPAPVYTSGNEVYINADSVTVTVSNDLTTQKGSDQTIYGQIQAYCDFENLKDSNDNKVLGFLTYLKRTAETTTNITNALNAKSIQNRKTSSLTINKGSCFVYYAITDTLNESPSWTKYGKGQTSTIGLEVNVNAGQYLWIASVEGYEYLYLWNQLLGDYNTKSALSKKDSAELSFGTNGTVEITYNCYVTGPRSSSGNVKLELSNIDRGGN